MPNRPSVEQHIGVVTVYSNAEDGAVPPREPGHGGGFWRMIAFHLDVSWLSA
jgi:hypothetical protein